MKSLNAYIIFCLILFGTHSPFSQDILELKNGSKIFGEILKVSKYDITFIDWHNSGAGEQVLSRTQFALITDNFDDVFILEKLYENDHYRSIQLSITSLFNSSLDIDYQWTYNRNISLEVNAAVHGQALNNDHAKRGLGIGGALKIKLPALFYFKHKPKHLLHGSFLKLAIGLGSVNEQLFEEVIVPPGTIELAKVNRNRNYIHFGPEVGYHWIFANRISIEGGIGIHVLEINADATELSSQSDFTSDSNYKFKDGDLSSDGNTIHRIFVRMGWAF